VKHDAGHVDDRCWQVDLVSGPLFSFDGTPSADYLQQAYTIGRTQLAWDYTHQATGSYPLDGIGYHIYVAQGLDSTAADASAAVAQNLAAVWNVVVANEGAATPKRLWISEYGWQADWVGAAGQAERMQAGFSAMQQLGKVAVALYFNFQDFPGATYGVFDDGGQRRVGADMLRSLADDNRPADGARLLEMTVPTLAPGETGDVTITIENRGSTTWGGDIRLAAAPGCPEATTENAIDWAPAAGSGYASSPLDARVFLPAEVAAGQVLALRVPIRAPLQTGEYTFAARMVHEGVGWFGATAVGKVVVTASGSGSGSSDPESPKPGGCSTTDGPCFGAIVVVLIVLRRRVRGSRDIA
jgi:hypothetical protein